VYLGPEFFTEIIHEGVYFHSPGRSSFCYRESALGTLTAITGKDPSIANAESVRDFIEHLKAVPESEHRSLDSARHWYLDSKKERDPWKRFLWSFLALEILVNKLSGKLYESVIARLDIKQNADAEFGNLEDVVSEMVHPWNRLTHVMKFTIVALELCPRTAEEDLVKFKRVNEARGKLAHGDLRREDDLPQAEVMELLDKYFAAAIERQSR
jgi:hypothetical protein